VVARAPLGCWALALAVALALAGAPGCTPSAKREAASLLVAMDRYQREGNASKVADAQAVAAVACTDAQVCETKRVCLDAIEPTARALSLKDEVSARVEDLQAKRLAPDSPEAQALPGKLDLATKLLNEGRSKMPLCERKLADLRIALGS
jgi:hypothetical protein